MIADDAVLTFAELDARSAALAGWLAARTDRGDRVAEQAAQFSTVGTRLVLGDAQYLESLSDTPKVAFGTPEWEGALGHRADELDGGPDDPAWLVFTSGSTGASKVRPTTARPRTGFCVEKAVRARISPDHGSHGCLNAEVRVCAAAGG